MPSDIGRQLPRPPALWTEEYDGMNIVTGLAMD